MKNKSQQLTNQLIEIESRWFSFLGKLEERMQEFSTEAIPELEDMFKTDEDQFKRTYQRMLSGITGQLTSIENKAREVEEKNVLQPLDKLEDKISDIDDDALSDFFEKVSDRCDARNEEFENKLASWMEKLQDTGLEDFEVKYQAIIDEYNTIKDQFSCKQCGSIIPIDRVLFIATHIACPACSTQNTFTPSSRASELDDVGLSLAHQRTKHLLQAHEEMNDKERELYYEMHKLEIEKIGYEISKDKEKIAELENKINELETQRKVCIMQAPELYKAYLTAKFEEWKKLVPELAEQNQKIYEQWMAQSR